MGGFWLLSPARTSLQHRQLLASRHSQPRTSSTASPVCVLCVLWLYLVCVIALLAPR